MLRIVVLSLFKKFIADSLTHITPTLKKLTVKISSEIKNRNSILCISSMPQSIPRQKTARRRRGPCETIKVPPVLAAKAARSRSVKEVKRLLSAVISTAATRRPKRIVSAPRQHRHRQITEPMSRVTAALLVQTAADSTTATVSAEEHQQMTRRFLQNCC